MNMAAPSAGTSNLTTTRDSVSVLLEGKTVPICHLIKSSEECGNYAYSYETFSNGVCIISSCILGSLNVLITDGRKT